MKKALEISPSGFSKGDVTAERQASGLHIVCVAGEAFSTLSELLGKTR